MSDETYTVTADQPLMVPTPCGHGRRHVNAGDQFEVTEEFGKVLMAQGVKLERCSEEDLQSEPVKVASPQSDAPPSGSTSGAEAGGAGGQKAAPVKDAKTAKEKPGPKPKK